MMSKVRLGNESELDTVGKKLSQAQQRINLPDLKESDVEATIDHLETAISQLDEVLDSGDK